MIEIVEKIACLLGVSRYGRDDNKRKKREAAVRRGKDTVDISDEARSMIADASTGNQKDDRKNGTAR